MRAAIPLLILGLVLLCISITKLMVVGLSTASVTGHVFCFSSSDILLLPCLVAGWLGAAQVQAEGEQPYISFGAPHVDGDLFLDQHCPHLFIPDLHRGAPAPTQRSPCCND
jgi:hypothetical protein